MPQLPTMVTTLDGVSDELKQYYSPVDANDSSAGFELSLDKSPTKTSNNEFRQENLKLRKQVEGMGEKLNKLSDLESKLDALQQAAGSDEDARNIAAGNIDAVVDRRVKAALTSGEQKYEALEQSFAGVQKQRDALLNQVNDTRIRDEMMGAFRSNKARLRDGAEVDLVSRARSVWSVDAESNRLVAKNPSTGEPLYGAEGKPLQMDEWAASTASKAAYLFDQGQGGGATGGRGDRKTTRANDGKEIDVSRGGFALARNLDDVLNKKTRVTMGE